MHEIIEKRKSKGQKRERMTKWRRAYSYNDRYYLVASFRETL